MQSLSMSHFQQLTAVASNQNTLIEFTTLIKKHTAELEALMKLNMGLEKDFHDAIRKTMTESQAVCCNILSLLSMLVLVKTMSCKRFKDAVKDNSTPPKALTDSIGSAMKSARDLSLNIPAKLQVLANKFCQHPSA